MKIQPGQHISYKHNTYSTVASPVYIGAKILCKFLNNQKSTKLGPVVQSVVSLTSSLRVISLTVLADSIYNILIYFAEKMWVAFALHSHFFSKKFQHICVSLNVNFNESLTNDVVSFEHLCPGFQIHVYHIPGSKISNSTCHEVKR